LITNQTIRRGILLTSVWGLSFGQSVPIEGPEAPPPIKVDVDVVNVLCTVYDKHGALVKDLRKEDFEVLENGRRQEIRYFARDTDLPLTVALLVDVSGSVRDFVDKEKGAALQFLESVLRPTDQAVLMGFSSTIILWQDFTSSPELLRIALAKLRPIPFRGLLPDGTTPSTLLYDAVLLTANEKLKNVAGRKAMVIVSDGLDNGSHNHLDAAVAALESTNTISYGVCYEGKFSGCSFLKDLSEPSGGRMFEAGKKVPLSRIFQIIEEEMRSQYAIGFVHSNGARDGAFRKLQVKVQQKGLQVRARKGYYASLPSSSGTDQK
jgi:VWFA-related protein